MSPVATSAWVANAIFDRLETLGVDPDRIARNATFAALGLDALDTRALAGELCRHYGIPATIALSPRTTIEQAIALIAGARERS